MSRRIEIELTSGRDDGTWTWRAAGAKQPRGALDGSLLEPGAKVGDVLRVEAEFEIDGIVVTAVLPTKEKKRAEPERLEVIGPPQRTEGVTTSLVPKSERPRPERGERPRRGEQGERRERGDRERGERRPPRERPERRPREGEPERERGRDRQGVATGAGRRERAKPKPAEGPDAPPKPKRLVAGTVHRDAVLATLAPAERPIAEQVLRGGIPAVRQAVEMQNAELRAKGEPEVRADPLVAMAEELLPRLKTADWRDRAEAAVKVLDDVALRDLRSVVAGADAVARDDEARLLASTLREALQRRLAEQRETWLKEVASALDEGRLVRALRLSARPPDAGTRFPADLALRLSEAAGAAMTPEVTPERWSTLLEAVVESPVRRSVKPAGLPADPGEDLLQAARQASGRVPALAGLLGIAMPPPPGPPRPPRPTKARPIPPPTSATEPGRESAPTH